jgi:hypothetical protein
MACLDVFAKPAIFFEFAGSAPNRSTVLVELLASGSGPLFRYTRRANSKPRETSERTKR